MPELYSRAAAWYEANGMPETAVDHAQAAGDAERVARLVLDLMNPVWASAGRHSPALDGVAGRAAIGSPLFRCSRSWRADLRAARTASEAGRWTAVAERLPATGTLPDGSTVTGTLAYLRANLCRDGAETMRRDAREAWDGLSPTSPYRMAMLHTEALSYVLDGDPDRADAVFAHTYDIATDFGALPMIALILAERFLIAAEREDWPAADALMVRAAEIP